MSFMYDPFYGSVGNDLLLAVTSVLSKHSNNKDTDNVGLVTEKNQI